MPPQAQSFASSYEAQSEAEDIDASIDDSLRSFMDKGDDFFANEDVDGNGLTRQDVTQQVRQNILLRLSEVNAESAASAEQERTAHAAYSGQLVTLYSSLQSTKRKYIEENDHYVDLVNADTADDERNASSFLRFFKFRNLRKKSSRKRRAALAAEMDTKIQGIRQKAENWRVVREDYKKNIMRKHYRDYDNLAKTWYELTHEYAMSTLPRNATTEMKRQMVANRAIPQEHAKKIVEYTGIYDMDSINAGIDTALANVNTAITADAFTIVPYKRLVDSQNLEDPENLTKTHTRILMLGEANAENGIKTRYKFDPSFLGDRAKHQFAAAESEDLVPDQPGEQPVHVVQPINNEGQDEIDEEAEQQEAQQERELRRHAENMHLESDRKDINNRFLFSEKNAEILHARLKRNGRTVYGFYMNGEFITNDTEGETVKGKQGQPDSRRVAGKKDMKFFGRRNWNKQEKAEKLRVAIRSSPFFKHVNARTIQYYAGYDAEGDYGEDLEKNMDKYWKKAGKDGITKAGEIQKLRQNPQAYSAMNSNLKGPALVAYIIDAGKRQRGENEQAFSFDDPKADPVLNIALTSDKKALQLACIAMLVNDDPRFWGLARKIVVDSRRVDARTRAKMKYLPETGNLMRMGLLEELANHQGVFSEVDLEEGDPLDFIDIPSRKVYMEELENRRGTGNWFKKNLLNGKFVSYAMKAASTGMSMYNNLSDAGNMLKDSDYEVDDDTATAREERIFWASYGETVAESNNISSVLSAAGIAVTGFLGGDMSVARDVGFQFFDCLEIVNQVTSIGKSIWKFIKYVYKKIKQKKPEDMTAEELRKFQAKQRETLKDLDFNGCRAVLKFLNTVVGLVNNLRDLASYHIAKDEDSAGWGSVVNETWGSFLEYKGPLEYICNTIQNGISILNDIIEIVASTKRIGRIDRADRDIETALSVFKSPRDNLRGVIDPDEENKRKLGEAASQNSQAQYFMSLTKMQSRKQRSAAGWDIGARVLSVAKDTFSMAYDPTGGVVSKVLRAVLSPAPMLVNFIGWTIGKLKYDRQNFNNNIASMLGDASYGSTPYFDKVLKRETGIVSSAYLVDLARIFMSIDTHALINKDNKSEGELDLAEKVVGTLYGNVNEESIKNVELGDMLQYAGFDGDSDWRSVLRNSIKS